MAGIFELVLIAILLGFFVCIAVWSLPSDVETVMDVGPDEMILFATTLPLLCGVGVALGVFDLPAKLDSGSAVNMPRTVMTIMVFFIGGVSPSLHFDT